MPFSETTAPATNRICSSSVGEIYLLRQMVSYQRKCVQRRNSPRYVYKNAEIHSCTGFVKIMSKNAEVTVRQRIEISAGDIIVRTKINSYRRMRTYHIIQNLLAVADFSGFDWSFFCSSISPFYITKREQPDGLCPVNTNVSLRYSGSRDFCLLRLKPNCRYPSPNGCLSLVLTSCNVLTRFWAPHEIKPLFPCTKIRVNSRFATRLRWSQLTKPFTSAPPDCTRACWAVLSSGRDPSPRLYDSLDQNKADLYFPSQLVAFLYTSCPSSEP